MKVVTIVGARPQFVKAAVISRELKLRGVEEKIIHTGQHFDAGMSDVFFQEMDIPAPHYNLAINNLGHGAMTGAMLTGIEEILISEKPSVVLVYGDTNSTLAGALAAKKLHIPVAHVEAGLRSFNMDMPEEVNRIVTDRISSVLYAPTTAAINNLKNEGYDNFNINIQLVGDVMQDAAYFYSGKAATKSTIISNLNLNDFVLCTLHRAENTDDPGRLQELVKGINALNKEISVVLPLHPRTAAIIKKLGITLEAIVIDPVGYFDMMSLLKHCKLVITDSGGLQKEAYFFAKNCVTMREQTEWIELVENGVNVLVGSSAHALVTQSRLMLARQSDFSKDLYGGGKAGMTIVSHLIEWVRKRSE